MTVSFFTICFIVAYLSFLTATNPATSATARSYAALVALEFDFDDQVLCKSFQTGRKYLFVNKAKDQVLSVVPMSYLVTKKDILLAKSSGKEIKFFPEPKVQRCVYQ